MAEEVGGHDGVDGRDEAKEGKRMQHGHDRTGEGIEQNLERLRALEQPHLRANPLSLSQPSSFLSSSPALPLSLPLSLLSLSLSQSFALGEPFR